MSSFEVSTQDLQGIFWWCGQNLPSLAQNRVKLWVLRGVLTTLEGLTFPRPHCKSLQGFMGLLQGNGSAGIPHLQAFTWYKITSNCVCGFTLRIHREC